MEAFNIESGPGLAARSQKERNVPAIGAVVFRQSVAKQSAKADADTPLAKTRTFDDLLNGAGNGMRRERSSGCRTVVQRDLRLEKFKNSAIPKERYAPLEKVLHLHRVEQDITPSSASEIKENVCSRFREGRYRGGIVPGGRVA